MSQSSRSMVRWSQIITIIPVMIREWLNMLTDIGQYKRNIDLVYKIISFPTRQVVDTLVNRDIKSMVLAKCISMTWVIFHATTALLILVGIVLLIKRIRENTEVYHAQKHWAILGLSIGFFSYVFFVGVGSMDYFLSWLQDPAINLNGDIMGYGLPLGIALLFLCHRV